METPQWGLLTPGTDLTGCPERLAPVGTGGGMVGMVDTAAGRIPWTGLSQPQAIAL